MTMTRWNYADGGVRLAGELHRPLGATNGLAVLVVHEADGIGGNVRRRCEMLSKMGFIAGAADLHGEGRVLPSQEIPVALEMFKANPARFRRRVRAGLDALVLASGVPLSRTAAIGYCFGGMAVLELARSGAPLAAVASFHGLLTTQQPAEKGQVSARIFASSGARDPLVPPADLAAFQAEMAAAEADWQLTIHGRALHSFTNRDVDGLGDPRMAYDPAADRQSWAALLAFLDEAFA
jgi:dienelactone hydrolase